MGRRAGDGRGDRSPLRKRRRRGKPLNTSGPFDLCREAGRGEQGALKLVDQGVGENQLDRIGTSVVENVSKAPVVTRSIEGVAEAPAAGTP